MLFVSRKRGGTHCSTCWSIKRDGLEHQPMLPYESYTAFFTPNQNRRVLEGERLGWRKSGCLDGKDWRWMEKIAEMPYFILFLWSIGVYCMMYWYYIVFGGSEIWKFAVFWSGLTSKVLILAYLLPSLPWKEWLFIWKTFPKKEYPKRLKRFHS